MLYYKMRIMSSIAGMLLLVLPIHSSVAAEIKDGLIARWSFNDCTANDTSGNGNDGISSAIPPECVRGKAGKALKFNAAGDYFAVANNPSLQQIEQKQAFTIGAFININEYYKNYFPILDKYDGSGFGWGVEIFTDEATQNNTIEIYNAGSELQPDTRYPCAISLKLHRWYHIAVTFGEGEVRYYINGKRVIGSADTCANSASVKLKSTDDNLYIGYNPSGLKEWDNGMLDQVMLYDRVLTPREIRKLFNTSKKARK